jgi:hypothetical protein
VSRFEMVIPRGFVRRLALWFVVYGFRRARSIQIISLGGLTLLGVLIAVAARTRGHEQSALIASAVLVAATVALQAVIIFVVVYRKERKRMPVGAAIQCIFGEHAFSVRISRMRVDFAYSDCKTLIVLGGFVIIESRTQVGLLILPTNVFPAGQRAMVLTRARDAR